MSFFGVNKWTGQWVEFAEDNRVLEHVYQLGDKHPYEFIMTLWKKELGEWLYERGRVLMRCHRNDTWHPPHLDGIELPSDAYSRWVAKLVVE